MTTAELPAATPAAVLRRANNIKEALGQTRMSQLV